MPLSAIARRLLGRTPTPKIIIVHDIQVSRVGGCYPTVTVSSAQERFGLVSLETASRTPEIVYRPISAIKSEIHLSAPLRDGVRH